jgi:GxxExxY protein
MHTDRKTGSEEPYPEQELTEKILAAAFKVQNTLGCGFLEKIYENALVVEPARDGLRLEQQKSLQVKYEGVVVGEYQADLVVDGRVIAKCKAVSHLDPVHEAQLLNYLKATGVRVGLLLNFGRTRLQYRRFVA